MAPYWTSVGVVVLVSLVLIAGVGGKPQKTSSSVSSSSVSQAVIRHTPTSTNYPPSDQEVNEELLENITNVEIKCATSEIRVKIPTPHPHFNGMVYPQVS